MLGGGWGKGASRSQLCLLQMACKGLQDREGSEKKTVKDCGGPGGDPMCVNMCACACIETLLSIGLRQNPLLFLTFQILYALRKECLVLTSRDITGPAAWAEPRTTPNMWQP